MSSPGHFNHQELRDLKPGWDSYSAKAIDPRCIEEAFRLWRELPGVNWTVVPCSDGGVQIEQHRDGLDIEVRVSPASGMETVPAPDCPHCDGFLADGIVWHGPKCPSLNRRVNT